MPVQDLTPQLRTRLSRVERIVGVFVSLATLLLIAGFAYYVYHTGKRKGWWTFKARYHTYVESGAGLNEGGAVRLLGFDVGRITKVEAMPPGSIDPVYIEFYVLDPYQGYIWSDSEVQVATGDFLGGRVIDIIPGGNSLEENPEAVLHASYKIVDGEYRVYNDQTGEYMPYSEESKGYPLIARESPAVMDRLETMANQVERALPGILDLTNRVNLVLSNVATMTAEAEATLATARPAISNVTVITANLRDPKGSLGEWALPTNLHSQILTTLTNANVTLTNASGFIAHTDTNVSALTTNIDATLINLANITSNLNQQVQSNTNLIKGLSDIIINADDMIQGLKGHWLLRSAFKNRREESEEEREGSSRSDIPTAPPKAGKWR